MKNVTPCSVFMVSLNRILNGDDTHDSRHTVSLIIHTHIEELCHLKLMR